MSNLNTTYQSSVSRARSVTAVLLIMIILIIYVTWDVTVATTLADSYIQASASSVGAAAEMAASRKLAKYMSFTFKVLTSETRHKPPSQSVMARELGP